MDNNIIKLVTNLEEIEENIKNPTKHAYTKSTKHRK